MKINEFVKDCFNKYLPHIYFLIIEDRKINIYENQDKSLIISTVKDLKYQLIKVLEIIKIENEMSFKVQLPNNKKGYFVPEKSILIIPKESKQVKISEDATLDNDLNKYINIDQAYLQENKNKIMYSKQYAIFDNKIYETLLLVDEIVGFIEQKEVNKLHRYTQEFKVVENTKTYSNNAMTKPVSIIKDYDEIFKTQYVMHKESKIRMKYNGKNLWINSKNTDLEFEIMDKDYSDLNELLIESILTQYEEKINNYHKYYNKLVSK